VPGYLDHYGEGDEKRSKRLRMVLIVAAVALVSAGSLYFGLRNYRQKARIKEFVELLQKRDYTAAYALWGCTESSPCKDYPLNKFMEDWGPQSPNAQIASFDITRSRACGSGVIVTVNFGGKREERFWVESRDLTVSYSPWSVCPAR
jgi:hypothetical protein